MNNSDSDTSAKTTIDTLANLATKYSKLHRNYNALCLQKKELIAKIKSVQYSMETLKEDILEAMKEQSIPAFKRNGLIFQTAEKSITKPVNNKDIINKLTEIIPERVEEAKNIISQTRSVTTETILKIKEEK